MTRAERYKRNYRIIKNVYHDTALAKRAQTWSDEHIYNDLGIRVGNRKTPELKQNVSQRQITSAKRRLANFQYGRSLGLSVKEAKRVNRYKREKIEESSKYHSARKKRFNRSNKTKRMDLWSAWATHRSPMPPEIEQEAREYNRSANVGGKPLDDYAKYGYIVAFYRFVENKPLNEIADLVEPDPHDSYRVIYATQVKV